MGRASWNAAIVILDAYVLPSKNPTKVLSEHIASSLWEVIKRINFFWIPNKTNTLLLEIHENRAQLNRPRPGEGECYSLLSLAAVRTQSLWYLISRVPVNLFRPFTISRVIVAYLTTLISIWKTPTVVLYRSLVEHDKTSTPFTGKSFYEITLFHTCQELGMIIYMWGKF